MEPMLAERNDVGKLCSSAILRPERARSKSPGDHQNEKDDDQNPDHADPAMSEAIAVSAEATAEATEQEDDEQDEKDGTKRHDGSSFGKLY